VDFVSLWGSTLHHIDDMPYNPLEYFPDVYTNFRKKGAAVEVRPLLPIQKKGLLPFCSELSKQFLSSSKYEPELKDFGFT
jgi:hypothetical protein